MQHQDNNLLSIPRPQLTELIVAGLTGATIALITSKWGWPGAVSGAALIPMVTTTISAVYKGYVDRAARVMLVADRPPPPPFKPFSGPATTASFRPYK